jgi:hypothetical protein
VVEHGVWSKLFEGFQIRSPPQTYYILVAELLCLLFLICKSRIISLLNTSKHTYSEIFVLDYGDFIVNHKNKIPLWWRLHSDDRDRKSNDTLMIPALSYLQPLVSALSSSWNFFLQISKKLPPSYPSNSYWKIAVTVYSPRTSIPPASPFIVPFLLYFFTSLVLITV